jgi:hypothetical protein
VERYVRSDRHGRVEGRAVEETPLLVDGQSPKVHPILERDIAASGDFYKLGDYRLGPLTPAHSNSLGDPAGVELSTINPPIQGTQDASVTFILRGPGLKPSGELFQKVRTEVTSALHFYIVVRRLSVKPGAE